MDRAPARLSETPGSRRMDRAPPRLSETPGSRRMDRAPARFSETPVSRRTDQAPPGFSETPGSRRTDRAPARFPEAPAIFLGGRAARKRGGRVPAPDGGFPHRCAGSPAAAKSREGKRQKRKKRDAGFSPASRPYVQPSPLQEVTAPASGGSSASAARSHSPTGYWDTPYRAAAGSPG